MPGKFKPSWTDRAIGWAFPKWGLGRVKSRMGLHAATGGLDRDRKYARSLKHKKGESYLPAGVDDIGREQLLWDSIDQIHCNPLAAGIINRKVNHVVGGGFRLQPRVDGKELELEREDAEAFNDVVMKEWQTHFNKTACDFDGQCDFGNVTALAFRSMLVTGDAFILLRRDEVADSLYKLKLQVISGDRVATPDSEASNKQVKDGVAVDAQGRVVGYWIKKNGDAPRNGEADYQFVPIRTNDGKTHVVHLFQKTRPGQYRGEPVLAPVLGILEDLDEYIKNELRASQVASLFTAFVKTSNPGEDMGWDADEESPYNKAGNKLESGAILSLGQDEDVSIASPNRPNSVFEAFVEAFELMIGIGVGIPFEVYTGKFTSSYSASRAALVLGEIDFKIIRKLIVERFCRPVYAEWFADAVSMGRIEAPRFDARDPIAMDAYLRSEWIGPGAPQLDAEKEAKAFVLKDQNNFASLQQIIQEMNGGDWKRVLDQIKLEQEYMEEIGLTRAAPAPQDAPESGTEDLESGENVDDETPDREDADEEAVDTEVDNDDDGDGDAGAEA